MSDGKLVLKAKQDIEIKSDTGGVKLGRPSARAQGHGRQARSSGQAAVKGSMVAIN